MNRTMKIILTHGHGYLENQQSISVIKKFSFNLPLRVVFTF